MGEFSNDARDDLPTPSSSSVSMREQRETEETVLGLFREFLAEHSGMKDYKDEAIRLHREKHIDWLHKAIYGIPRQFSGLDASRPWFVFWICHALELLRDDNFIEDPEFRKRMVTFLTQCICPRHGGFGGGPKQLSHMATTYAGVAALCIGESFAAANLDRELMYRFLLARKDPKTGGFSMHADGELDIRGTYCAIAVASMLQILTPELAERVDEYVLSHQSWDGGLSGEPGLEAHGGYSYCGFAALAILGCAVDTLDVERLLHWLCHRQMSLEGGYQGRTNKLVDSCYSFWQGATFALVRHAYEFAQASEGGLSEDGVGEVGLRVLPDVPKGHSWTQPEPLQMYVFLACQDEERGGLRDKPGKRPDFYHTCYSLSGVSVNQSVVQADGRVVRNVVGNPETNDLQQIDPFYNVGLPKSQRMREFFAGLPPFRSPTRGEVGQEGAGVVAWRKRFRFQ
ncbi:unnamed protein product [Amoebophrya sp. A25]|nr:unnamed protein product [Amoebophrya sp. A25]|eukprot:GSA25T00012012001.1